MGNKLKRNVHIFESYARSDGPLVKRFSTRLQDHLAASIRYDYKQWRDTSILVGQRWRDEIEDALKECDGGILYLSPSFLGSAFIGEHELPRFVGKRGKLVLPLLLRPLDFDRQDLKGLEQHQIFMARERAFSQCRTQEKELFVGDFFSQVERAVDRRFQGRRPR